MVAANSPDVMEKKQTNKNKQPRRDLSFVIFQTEK